MIKPKPETRNVYKVNNLLFIKAALSGGLVKVH